MPDAPTLDVSLRRAVQVREDDVSQNGGPAGTLRIEDGQAPGRWMPELVAQEDGDLDVDTEVQYQLAYLWVQSDHILSDVVVSLQNGIAPFSASTVTVAPTSASDGSSKLVRLWGKSGGILRSEDLVLAGLTPVTGSLVFSELYRAELRESLTTALAQTTAAANIYLTDGSENIGLIPQGKRTATREFAFAAAPTTGNMAYWDNRRTEPGGSLTWSVPCFAQGETIALPGPLFISPSANRRAGIYCRQTAQPGLATAEVDLLPWFDAKVTWGL